MILLFLLQINTTSMYFLNAGMHIMEKHNVKEEIELSNGNKIYYISDVGGSDTVIDFRFELYDLPSNTGLYHLLEHLLGVPTKNLITSLGGSYFASTSVNTMSFSCDLRSNLFSEVVDEFYEILFAEELDKEVIMREIQHIEEEVNANLSFKDPFLFYFSQNFSYTDEHNLFKLGNGKYFEFYFKEYISKGNLLGEEGVEKFSQSNFDDMSEGYHELLTFLLKTRLRRYPMTVLIKTNLQKEEVIKMFKKFDERQFSLINKRKNNYDNSDEFKLVKLIPCEKNILNIVLKCPIPKNLYIVVFFLENLYLRLQKTFEDKVRVYPFFLDNNLYISFKFIDFIIFDLDYIPYFVFQDEVPSRFISYSEFEYFFKHDNSVKGNIEIIRVVKKFLILLNLMILKTIEGVEIDYKTIKKRYDEKMLLIHGNYLEISCCISLIHNMIINAPPLFYNKDCELCLEDLEEFKKHLLTPSNYTSIVSDKFKNNVGQNPVNDFPYLLFPLEISDIITSRNDMAILSEVSKVKFKNLDIVVSDYRYNSFTLVFKSGVTLDDKIAFICAEEILERYEIHTREYFSKLSAKVIVKSTFQNVLEITILSSSNVFEHSLLSFLATLIIFPKSNVNLELVKKTVEDLKDSYKIVKNEEIDDIKKSLKSFTSSSDFFKRLHTKCLYFGKENEKLINQVKRYLELSCFNFTSKDDFPLVSDKVPLPWPKLEGFNSEYICLYNKDVKTFEELIKNKIAFLLFGIHANDYFLHKHTLGYNSEICVSTIVDFSFLQVRTVTPKSKQEIEKNIKEFIKIYYSWIDNLGVKKFKKLKRFLLKFFIEKEPFNDLRLNSYISKWGLIENYTNLRPRIEKFIANDLSLKILKKWLKKKLLENLIFSFNIQDE